MRDTSNIRKAHPKDAKATASEQKVFKGNRIFWVIMLCFFVSAAAYYLDMWLQG